MNLKLITESFDRYKKHLRKHRNNSRLHYWETQAIFQKKWHIETDNFLEMYDKSLQNSHTKRAWKRRAYEPKRMMMAFMKMTPDVVIQMFGDLLNENKGIEGRVGRFIFYCDQLLAEYKSTYPLSIDNNHYHQNDYEMISLYLAFAYPNKYAPYQHDAFVGMLKKIGVTKLPLVPDFERFVKISHTLYKLMQKDPKLMQLHQERLIPAESYTKDSLLLVYDYYMSMAEERS